MHFANYFPLVLTALAFMLLLVFFSVRKRAKKLPLLIHLLVFAFVLSLTGLIPLAGNLSLASLPLIFLLVVAMLGVLHTWALYRFQTWSRYDLSLAETLFTLATALLGSVGYTVIAMAIHQTAVNSFLTAMIVLPFMAPFLLHKTFALWKAIPTKIFFIWQYADSLEVPEVIQSDSIRIRFRISKDEDSSWSRFTVQAPMNMRFCDVFHYFLYGYNQQHPKEPILTHTAKRPFGWYFYIETPWWQKKGAINPNLSIYRNELKDSALINARRIFLNG